MGSGDLLQISENMPCRRIGQTRPRHLQIGAFIAIFPTILETDMPKYIRFVTEFQHPRDMRQPASVMRQTIDRRIERFGIFQPQHLALPVGIFFRTAGEHDAVPAGSFVSATLDLSCSDTPVDDDKILR